MCDKRFCACEKKQKEKKISSKAPSFSSADRRGVSVVAESPNGSLDHSDLSNELEDAFVKFLATDSNSLLKKYLLRDVFDKLKNRRTSHGSSLRDVIQSGLANPDSGIGVYAPDPESYSVFSELFDPIIQDYHGGFSANDVHPELDWGDPDTLGNLDPTGKYVVSTRVRCGRSLKGYPFNPTMTEAHYREIQTKVRKLLIRSLVILCKILSCIFRYIYSHDVDTENPQRAE